MKSPVSLTEIYINLLCTFWQIQISRGHTRLTPHVALYSFGSLVIIKYDYMKVCKLDLLQLANENLQSDHFWFLYTNLKLCLPRWCICGFDRGETVDFSHMVPQATSPHGTTVGPGGKFGPPPQKTPLFGRSIFAQFRRFGLGHFISGILTLSLLHWPRFPLSVSGFLKTELDARLHNTIFAASGQSRHKLATCAFFLWFHFETRRGRTGGLTRPLLARSFF